MNINFSGKHLVYNADYMNLDEIHGAGHSLEIRSYLKKSVPGLQVRSIGPKVAEVGV